MKKSRIEEYKLGGYVTFHQGVNPTRIENKISIDESHYYDQLAFERDYNFIAQKKIDMPLNNSYGARALVEGDVIISNQLQLATIVGSENAGKVYSLNFTKVAFEGDRLDKKYFLYLFNANEKIKRQKERQRQGVEQAKMPIKALQELIIPLIPLEEQKKIGHIYTEGLRLQSKLAKYSELLGKFTKELIRGNLELR